jgi:DNA-binding transcriptional LysR family regulator
MDIKQLKSFVTAAQLRSVSKAAAHLGVGQPTISTHISKLEKEIGTPLFIRIQRPIQLTAAGSKLAELAGPLVQEFDYLLTETQTSQKAVPITIASVYDLISHYLDKVVAKYRTLYPRTQLHIVSGLRSDVLDMVHRGEADVGLVAAKVKNTKLCFEPLFEYDRVLMVPLGHPILDIGLQSLDDLAQWPLILIRRGSRTWVMLERWFRERGLPYEVALQIDSIELAKKYVKLGVGIAVGSRIAIDTRDHDEIALVSISHLLPLDTVGLVTLKGKSLSVPIKEFVSIAKETLGRS